MKKTITETQLRKIIREELNKIKRLNEGVTRNRAELFYNKYKIPHSKRMINPGVYDVKQGDMLGRYYSKVATIKITEPMNEWDLEVQLAIKTGYLSPWRRLDSLELSSAPYGDNIFPLEEDIFQYN